MGYITVIARVARDLWQRKQTLSSGCALGLGSFTAINPWHPCYNYYISDFGEFTASPNISVARCRARITIKELAFYVVFYLRVYKQWCQLKISATTMENRNHTPPIHVLTKCYANTV